MKRYYWRVPKRGCKFGSRGRTIWSFLAVTLTSRSGHCKKSDRKGSAVVPPLCSLDSERIKQDGGRERQNSKIQSMDKKRRIPYTGSDCVFIEQPEQKSH